MASKQHSFKLNLEEPTEKQLHDFLTGKPTTHIVVEALKLYIRFEEARKAAIENAINAIGSPVARTAAAASQDDIQDFEL